MEQGWPRERAAMMVVELGWQLGFGLEAKLAWRCVGEVHPSLYVGVEGVRKD
jgi:hypothetical protein